MKSLNISNPDLVPVATLASMITALCQFSREVDKIAKLPQDCQIEWDWSPCSGKCYARLTLRREGVVLVLTEVLVQILESGKVVLLHSQSSHLSVEAEKDVANLVAKALCIGSVKVPGKTHPYYARTFWFPRLKTEEEFAS